MAGILAAYNGALVRRPYLANCLTAATLFGAGDLLAQQGIEGKGLANHDIGRTFRLTVFGGSIFGPFATTWFRILGRLPISDKHKVAKVGTSVALDQLVFASTNVGLFLSALTYMEGKDTNAVRQRLNEAYWPTLTMNWKVWIPVQLVNFAVTPPPLRLVVVNVVALFWNSYLSWISGRAPKTPILPE